MQESLSSIKPSVEPVTVQLTPRDLFTLHTACEAAILEMTDIDFADNELRTRMEDLEFRLRNMLKAGGHVK
jgi:hypothetical protein